MALRQSRSGRVKIKRVEELGGNWTSSRPARPRFTDTVFKVRTSGRLKRCGASPEPTVNLSDRCGWVRALLAHSLTC